VANGCGCIGRGCSIPLLLGLLAVVLSIVLCT
jgi:hypothetical protein